MLQQMFSFSTRIYSSNLYYRLYIYVIKILKLFKTICALNLIVRIVAPNHLPFLFLFCILNKKKEALVLFAGGFALPPPLCVFLLFYYCIELDINAMMYKKFSMPYIILFLHNQVYYERKWKKFVHIKINKLNIF